MPLTPVREYLAMCDATRRDLTPAQRADCDCASAQLRETLIKTYGLNPSDVRTLLAVAAGVVEGMGAAIDHTADGVDVRGINRGALAMGWALYDLAAPHLDLTDGALRSPTTRS
jgi:hypothetical protein